MPAVRNYLLLEGWESSRGRYLQYLKGTPYPLVVVGVARTVDKDREARG